MPKNAFFKLATMATLLAFSAACASSTVIRSSPTGAKLFLNGEPVGKTPYTMTDSKIVFSSTTVRLVKDGYEPYSTVITRAEEFDVAPFCGGFFFAFPLWLWVLKYKPEHVFELDRRGGAGGSNVPSSSSPDTM